MDAVVIVGKWGFVGEQVRSAEGRNAKNRSAEGRSAEGEAKYNKRWLSGLVVGPLLLGALAAVWIFSVADRLPAELASHWNAKNEVDGYMSVIGAALMAFLFGGGIGAVVAPLALLLRGQSVLVARIGVGFGLAFGIAMTALSVAVVAGQLDLADVSQAQISGPVMAVGIAAAFVLGWLATWLYRPADVDRTESSETVATNEAASQDHTTLGTQGRERAARGETLQIRVSMGAWKWCLSLGVGLIVAVSTYFIFPGLALLGVVVGGFIWVFCQGAAVIGPGGIKVLASGFWKLMPLNWQDINSAEVRDINAMDYGGWGYRMGGGSVGFIMGNGPALVMKGGFHETWVITMPNLERAGEAAALANAYVHAAKVQS